MTCRVHRAPISEAVLSVLNDWAASHCTPEPFDWFPTSVDSLDRYLAGVFTWGEWDWGTDCFILPRAEAEPDRIEVCVCRYSQPVPQYWG